LNNTEVTFHKSKTPTVLTSFLLTGVLMSHYCYCHDRMLSFHCQSNIIFNFFSNLLTDVRSDINMNCWVYLQNKFHVFTDTGEIFSWYSNGWANFKHCASALILPTLLQGNDAGKLDWAQGFLPIANWLIYCDVTAVVISDLFYYITEFLLSVMWPAIDSTRSSCCASLIHFDHSFF